MYATKRSCYLLGRVILLVIMVLLLAGFPTAAAANHRNNGASTCWSSGPAWSYHYTYYNDCDWSIPSDWAPYITNAAAAWNSADGKTFLSRHAGSSNRIIVQNKGYNNGLIAQVDRYETTRTTLGYVIMTFNSYYPHKPNAGGSNWYDVQNTATHEFGHFVLLWDQSTSSCSEATMYYRLAPGETKKRTLSPYDVSGINWQYP